MQVILAVIVILIKDSDSGVGNVLGDIFGVDFGLGDIVRLPTHGPGKFAGVVPFPGPRGHEQMRGFLLVHVAVNGCVGGGAERLKDEQHLIALHQPPRHFNRFGRAVAVVVGNEIDFSSVDAPLGFVEHLEIGGDGAPDGAIGGRRTTVGIDVANLDFLVGDAGAVSGALGRRAQQNHRHPEQQEYLHPFLDFHSTLLMVSIGFPHLTLPPRRRQKDGASPSGAIQCGWYHKFRQA